MEKNGSGLKNAEDLIMEMFGFKNVNSTEHQNQR